MPFVRRRSGDGGGRVGLAGRIVIVASCVYVAAFSYWAIFGDLASTHIR